jgi:hypothetical protein
LCRYASFGAQVTHTLQQLTGDITLNIPDVQIESVEKAVEDYDVVVALENAVQEWTGVLSSVGGCTSTTRVTRVPLCAAVNRVNLCAATPWNITNYSRLVQIFCPGFNR